MDVAEAVGRRYDGTVAVWFTSHYQVDTRDWDNIEEFGGPYHPLAGYYRSNDPSVLTEQLRDIRRASIDAIVYDVFSTGTWDLTDLPKDRVLPMLVEALSDQDHEHRKLQLIIWLEKYLGNPTVEQYDYALNYVREHLAERDSYFRYNARPLVVAFLNGRNDAINEIECTTNDIEIRRIRPYYSDVWCYVDFYPQMVNKEWMVVSPGFDDYLENAYIARHIRKNENADLKEIRRKRLFADREDGTFFERQMLRARGIDPAIIFISGWNDWQYGNQIEPAVEYGYTYVDLAARLLGRSKETEPYRDSNDAQETVPG
jgi:hypothetical protein